MLEVVSVETAVILNLSVVIIARVTHAFIVLVTPVRGHVAQFACSVFPMQWLFFPKNSHYLVTLVL